MSEWRPAEVFPVGQFILEELEARELDQAWLLRRLGWPAERLDRLLSGDLRVSARIAEQLAQYCGGSAVLWINIDLLWRRYRQS